MPWMEAIRAAQMQRATRPQNAIERLYHVEITVEVLEHFEADDLVESALFSLEIVQIPVLEPQPARIRSSVIDKKILCLPDLIRIKVQRDDARSGPIRQPGEIPVAAARVQHVPRAALPEPAQRCPIPRVKIQPWENQAAQDVMKACHRRAARTDGDPARLAARATLSRSRFCWSSQQNVCSAARRACPFAFPSFSFELSSASSVAASAAGSPGG